MHTDASSEELGPAPPPAWLLALAFIGFFSLGLPDAAIGIAWPSVRETYQLRQQALGLVLAMSGLGYLASSFSYGRIARVWGLGLILAGSTALVSSAMFGFALAPWWFLFILFGAVHGLGSGAIDSGLNAYAAHHFPTRHLIWLHAFYCAGAMSGPVIMTAMFVSEMTYRQGYFVFGTSLALLSLLFLLTSRWWGTASAPADADRPHLALWSMLRVRVVRLQMILFFLYTGLEVACSQWTFTVLTESRSVSRPVASTAVALFWAGLLCGRLLFGALVDRIGVDSLVRFSLLCASAGGMLFALPRLPAQLTLLGLCLVGLGLAPVFPCLMARTPRRLGPEMSEQAVGLQVGAAMIGGAAVPGSLGLLAGAWGLTSVSSGIALLLAVLFLLHERLLRESVRRMTTAPS